MLYVLAESAADPDVLQVPWGDLAYFTENAKRRQYLRYTAILGFLARADLSSAVVGTFGMTGQVYTIYY